QSRADHAVGPRHHDPLECLPCRLRYGTATGTGRHTPARSVTTSAAAAALLTLLPSWGPADTDHFQVECQQRAVQIVELQFLRHAEAGDRVAGYRRPPAIRHEAVPQRRTEHRTQPDLVADRYPTGHRRLADV